MKTLSILLVLIFCLLKSSAFADERSTIPPNKTYKNETKSPEYLVIELAPGKEFTNESKYTFKVLSLGEITAFEEDQQLQAKIDCLELQVKSMKSKIDEVDSELSKTNKKKQTIKN